MREISEWLLSKVVSSDSSNTVAKKLLEIINTVNDVNTIEWITLFAGVPNETTSYKKDNPLQFDRIESADYRIKKLKLRGFRKFPFKERGYYSLDFTLQKEPCSCFFIGSNGSGKTSLFSSLQETCSGAFTAAESRGVQKNLFMQHVGRDASSVDVIVDTCSDEIELQNISKSQLFPYRQFLQPFFCSEYDIRMMTDSKDITSYIINQTGYRYTFNLLSHLNNMYNDCCKQKDTLKKKNETSLLSNKNERGRVIQKLELLNAVFDDVVDYRYRNRKNISKLQFSRIINDLRNPLNIKSINRNSKNYIRDISKAVEQLPEILSRLKAEHSRLQGMKLCGSVIDDAYMSLIYRITNLLEYYSTREDEDQEQDIKNAFNRKIVMQSLHKKILLLDLDDINDTRRNYADVLDKLRISIIDEKTPRSYVEDLLKEIDSYKAFPKDNGISESDQLELLENKLDQLKKCKDNLQNLYKTCLYKSYEITKEFCEIILNEFNSSEEKFQFSIDKDTGRLDVNYYVDKCAIAPTLYLNSFRFKLFTLCIKIGMAFSVMQMFNISFPLVLDDVFYSSDFSNREKVRMFIQKTFELYHKTIETTTNLPLQIIFFTHDEVILEAAVKGMEELNDAFKYGRIFNYQEMESEINDNKGKVYKSISNDCNISVVFS